VDRAGRIVAYLDGLTVNDLIKELQVWKKKGHGDSGVSVDGKRIHNSKLVTAEWLDENYHTSVVELNKVGY
jgi:hypothetical protein